jgi:molybdopterin converting factor small subunit
MTVVSEPVEVTVRFFAAARAAAGAETDSLTLGPGATVAELVGELCCRSDELARVLQRCSFLMRRRGGPKSGHHAANRPDSGRVTPVCGRMSVIYVTSRSGHEMATARLRA